MDCSVASCWKRSLGGNQFERQAKNGLRLFILIRKKHLQNSSTHKRAQKFRHMKKETIEYESPRMEILNVEVEKGFELSGTDGSIEDMPIEKL